MWLGIGGSLYVLLMSISGSLIVFRNELEKTSPIAPIEWLVNLHENLLSGNIGRFVNGIGSICLILLCITGAVVWWPGIREWRRSLTVNWRAHFGRINWDLHSALGFWFFFFVLIWGISGFYFAFPDAVNGLLDFLHPGKDVANQNILSWLSLAHFGRFGWFTEALWAVFGLIPAVLSFTGIFLCCHRAIYKTSPKDPIPRK